LDPAGHRIVAAEVGGLAHLAQGVAEGLARLAAEQGHERGAVALEQLGQAFQDRGASLRSQLIPGRLGPGGRVHGRGDVGGRGLDHHPGGACMVGRVGDQSGNP